MNETKEEMILKIQQSLEMIFDEEYPLNDYDTNFLFTMLEKRIECLRNIKSMKETI